MGKNLSVRTWERRPDHNFTIIKPSSLGSPFTQRRCNSTVEGTFPAIFECDNQICIKFNIFFLNVALQCFGSVLPRCCCKSGYTVFYKHRLYESTVKGVVRSKIGFFKNWPGRDIAFYQNKIRQKLAEIWGVRYNSLKTKFLSDFG